MPAALSQSSVFSFPDFSPTATLSLGLTEAEALSIGAGFAVASNPHPSAMPICKRPAPARRRGAFLTVLQGFTI